MVQGASCAEDRANGVGQHRGRPGWQDGHACTTSGLREFFQGAYTGPDWQMQVQVWE